MFILVSNSLLLLLVSMGWAGGRANDVVQIGIEGGLGVGNQ
jgi:hypothetical protein